MSTDRFFALFHARAFFGGELPHSRGNLEVELILLEARAALSELACFDISGRWSR